MKNVLSSPSENIFHKSVYLAHLVTSNLFSCNCNKMYLKYKHHEKETPFRKGKKGLWEEKKTMNYFSYIYDETSLP